MLLNWDYEVDTTWNQSHIIRMKTNFYTKLNTRVMIMMVLKIHAIDLTWNVCTLYCVPPLCMNLLVVAAWMVFQVRRSQNGFVG